MFCLGTFPHHTIAMVEPGLPTCSLVFKRGFSNYQQKIEILPPRVKENSAIILVIDCAFFRSIGKFFKHASSKPVQFLARITEPSAP